MAKSGVDFPLYFYCREPCGVSSGAYAVRCCASSTVTPSAAAAPPTCFGEIIPDFRNSANIRCMSYLFRIYGTAGAVWGGPRFASG